LFSHRDCFSHENHLADGFLIAPTANFWPRGKLEIRIALEHNSIFAYGQTKPVQDASHQQSANNKDFKLIGSFNAKKSL